MEEYITIKVKDQIFGYLKFENRIKYIYPWTIIKVTKDKAIAEQKWNNNRMEIPINIPINKEFTGYNLLNRPDYTDNYYFHCMNNTMKNMFKKEQLNEIVNTQLFRLKLSDLTKFKDEHLNNLNSFLFRYKPEDSVNEDYINIKTQYKFFINMIEMKLKEWLARNVIYNMDFYELLELRDLLISIGIETEEIKEDYDLELLA